MKVFVYRFKDRIEALESADRRRTFEMTKFKHSLFPEHYPAWDDTEPSPVVLGKRKEILPCFHFKNPAQEGLPGAKVIWKKSPDEPKRDSANMVSQKITKLFKKMKPQPK